MKRFILAKVLLLMLLASSSNASSNSCIDNYKNIAIVQQSANVPAKKGLELVKQTTKQQEPSLNNFPKLLEAKLNKRSKLTLKELNEIKDELIAYFKSFGTGKRIVIFTGATNLDPEFKPTAFSNLRRPIKKQNSGVVTVMQVMAKDIKRLTGVDVRFVTPEEFGIHYQMKYQDIVAVMAKNKELKKILSEQDNLAVHIMVEDQLGIAAKKFLEKRNIPYTTAYHTDFAQYAIGFSEFYLPKLIHNTIMGGPKRKAFVEQALYKILKGFHEGSDGIMVPTNTMLEKLVAQGFPKDLLRFWSHGVDIDMFHPSFRDPYLYERELDIALEGRPVALFVGRISAEKNIRDFLDAKLESKEILSDGSIQVKQAVKVVIGMGPELQQLKTEYPDVYFLGRKEHDTELPRYMASADGFVFPSLSETYGLVGPESMAGGTPALGYRVQGTKDWNIDPKAGVMVEYTSQRSENLKNIENGWQTLRTLNRDDVRAYAETIPWERSILEFLFFLKVLNPEQRQKIVE